GNRSGCARESQRLGAAAATAGGKRDKTSGPARAGGVRQQRRRKGRREFRPSALNSYIQQRIR
ncbi:hypothetical protein HispidOSU_019551, partial [Sigmodon hispidus]